MKHHYSGSTRGLHISHCFGLYSPDGPFGLPRMIGAMIYGEPAMPDVSKKYWPKNPSIVLELNRLVLKNNEKNQASILIGASLKLLPKPKIIVSYADTAQNHLGVVYQATNFMFTGTTKPRTDMAGKDGKHSRHHLGDRTKRVYRSAKHRYVYILGNKKDKRRLMKDFNYEVMPYPKEKQNDNQ